MKKYYTFVRVFGATRPPHSLPKYAPNILLSIEITYETKKKGSTTYMSEKK
jgi:hypothetical protein